jgi:ATP-dependent exoDNAse (exonuclease V) alpha subunit
MNQYEYIQGIAGTGKSYQLKDLHAKNPQDTVLTATTGIAAVNMGEGITINSLLWYYNSQSLLDNWTSGKLDFRLGKVYSELGIRHILLDEVSMLPASDLTVLCLALDRLNHQLHLSGKSPMGLVLAGDFAQLPPIEGGYAFESEQWKEKFDGNTIILRDVHRQDDADFIEALGWVRQGEGKKAADYFEPLMGKLIDPMFEGTTLYPYNAAVDRHNAYRLERVKGDKVSFKALRSNKQRPEWKGIPDDLQLKEGALVMILANKSEAGELIYCNGDLGELVAKKDDHAVVELQRGGTVEVSYITRNNEDNVKGKKKVVGSITYMPLRLAYGSTVHKSQGLTLDSVQVDFRADFYTKTPGMLYVALSRARSKGGLQLVGGPKTFVKHCKLNKKVERFL